MQIYCDFDGTIAMTDTTDQVLEQLADPAWEGLEARWLAGEITAAECMRGQVAMIGGDDAALDAVLDSVEIRPGFHDFVDWCHLNDVALFIVSDGVDRFINRILARNGLLGLPIIANRLVGDAVSGRSLRQPWSRSGCAAGSGVCKCQVIAGEDDGSLIVFVGDGRSDFCVSQRADLLFARDKLADYARSRSMPHQEFDDFHSITATLAAVAPSAVKRVAN